MIYDTLHDQATAGQDDVAFQPPPPIFLKLNAAIAQAYADRDDLRVTRLLTAKRAVVRRYHGLPELGR